MLWNAKALPSCPISGDDANRAALNLGKLISGLAVLVTCLAAAAPAWAAPRPSAIRLGTGTPIQHVIIVDLENHSFDNVLGRFCVQSARCDGAAVGVLPNGSTIELTQATDVVPNVLHGPTSQTTAINGGSMNG